MEPISTPTFGSSGFPTKHWGRFNHLSLGKKTVGTLRRAECRKLLDAKGADYDRAATAYDLQAEVVKHYADEIVGPGER